MKKTLLIFDIDGTLSNTVTLHQSAFLESLEAIGVRSKGHALNHFKHHTDSYIARQIYETDQGKAMDAEVFEDFKSHLAEKVLAEYIEEIPGAKKLMKWVDKQPHLYYCYATGALRRTAIHKLESLQLPYSAELVTASDELPQREAIVEEAIKQAKLYWQTSFERTIALGDGIWDLKTAQNLKLDFIGIGNINRVRMVEAGCQMHFTDCRELLEVKDQWFN